VFNWMKVNDDKTCFSLLQFKIFMDYLNA